jgi:hypothetical protein
MKERKEVVEKGKKKRRSQRKIRKRRKRVVRRKKNVEVHKGIVSYLVGTLLISGKQEKVKF